MRVKKILDSFNEGIKIIAKNPSLVLSGLVLWLVLLGVSSIGKYLAPNFQTTGANVAWTIAVAFVSFIGGSYFLAGMIGVSRKPKEKTDRRFFANANRFWLRSFFVILFILISSLLIGRIAHYGALYIGRAAGLETANAVIVFVLIYLLGLLSLLIFLTFSNFMLVIKNLKIHRAVYESIKFVKKEYLATLILNLAFFALFFALDWIRGFIGDILLFGLLLPYFVAVLTRFVETVDLKK